MLEPNHLVAHQFDNLKQQHDADTLGMWLFLGTEVMFFGALFTAYAVYRSAHPDIFGMASRDLNVVLGTLNTTVLLCSSLSMAFAVRSAEIGDRKWLMRLLVITMALGIAFLGIKGIEYMGEYHDSRMPAIRYDASTPQAAGAEIFWVLYFIMTGLHAFHLTIGIALVGLLAFLTWRGRITHERHMPVDLIGLYWHFVDIVWVFVYPLLYLIDRRR